MNVSCRSRDGEIQLLSPCLAEAKGAAKLNQNPSVNRWRVLSRVLAAGLGGYAVAYAVTAFLAVYLPLASPDRVVFSSLGSFAVWIAVAVYVFAARSTLRVWLSLIGLTAVLCLAAFLSGELRTRP